MLALAVVLACFAAAPLVEAEFAELPTPRNVRLEKSTEGDQTAVVVHWDFEKPQNASLKKIEFVLLLEADGRAPRKFHKKFLREPFSYTIRNVPPLTKFTLRIKATSPNWEDSKIRNEYFDTMPPGPPPLPAPRNLTFDLGTVRVAQKVVLHWDFAAPKNLDLRKIEFALSVKADGQKTRKVYLRFKSAPFNYTFQSLSPATKYTVKLRATSLNWKDSDNCTGNFFTLPAEWPTPTITNVTSKIRENFAEYTVKWDMEPVPGLLEFFEIKVCDNACLAYRRDKSSREARVPVEFLQYVKITVIAFFNSRSIAYLEQESEVYKEWSPRGDPQRILEVKAIALKNEISLAYHPPFHPNGPLSYYEVIMCDPSKGPVEFSNTMRKVREAKFFEPIPVSTVLELMYKPLISATTSKGAWENFSSARLSEQAVGFSTSCVRVKTTFKKPELDSFFTIDQEYHKRKYIVGADMIELYGLSLYERIHLSIRSCILYDEDGKKPDVCGKPAGFIVGPIKNGTIRNPVMEFGEDGLVVLTWEMPNMIGSILGFKMRIEREPGSDEEVEIRTIDVRARSTVIRDRTINRKSVVEIAAFHMTLSQERSPVEQLGRWHRFRSPESGEDGGWGCALSMIAFPSLLCFLLAQRRAFSAYLRLVGLIFVRDPFIL